MKNRIVAIKRILLVILTITSIYQANAQDMEMPMHHHMSLPGKPVFLTMMDTMMIQMDAAPKGRSVEAEFFLQMIPHHQGAIHMAQYEITHGKNFTMVQLAKSILAEQSSELSQMQVWLKAHPASNGILESAVITGFHQSMETMMATMPPGKQLTDTDHAFAAVMIPHHRAALDMAKLVLKHGHDMQAIAFAKSLISNEQIEVEQMSSYIH